MSKFLSEEWVQEVTATLNEHQGFKNAIGAADLGIQFSTSEAPEGDVDYFLHTSGGNSTIALGALEDAGMSMPGDRMGERNQEKQRHGRAHEQYPSQGPPIRGF